MHARGRRMACQKPKHRLKRPARRMSVDGLNKAGKSEMEAISTQVGGFAPNAEPQLSEEIQNRIGDQLRLLYDQIVDEAVPQSLLELLRRLDAKE